MIVYIRPSNYGKVAHVGARIGRRCRRNRNIGQCKCGHNVVCADLRPRAVRCVRIRGRVHVGISRTGHDFHIVRIDKPRAGLAVGRSRVNTTLDTHRLVAGGLDETAVAGLRAALRLDARTGHDVGVVLRDHLNRAAVAVHARIRRDDGLAAKRHRVGGINTDVPRVTDRAIRFNPTKIPHIHTRNRDIATNVTRSTYGTIDENLARRSKRNVAGYHAAAHINITAGCHSHIPRRLHHAVKGREKIGIQDNISIGRRKTTIDGDLAGGLAAHALALQKLSGSHGHLLHAHHHIGGCLFAKPDNRDVSIRLDHALDEHAAFGQDIKIATEMKRIRCIATITEIGIDIIGARREVSHLHRHPAAGNAIHLQPLASRNCRNTGIDIHAIRNSHRTPHKGHPLRSPLPLSGKRHAGFDGYHSCAFAISRFVAGHRSELRQNVGGLSTIEFRINGALDFGLVPKPRSDSREYAAHIDLRTIHERNAGRVEHPHASIGVQCTGDFGGITARYNVEEPVACKAQRLPRTDIELLPINQRRTCMSGERGVVGINLREGRPLRIVERGTTKIIVKHRPRCGKNRKRTSHQHPQKRQARNHPATRLVPAEIHHAQIRDRKDVLLHFLVLLIKLPVLRTEPASKDRIPPSRHPPSPYHGAGMQHRISTACIL